MPYVCRGPFECPAQTGAEHVAVNTIKPIFWLAHPNVHVFLYNQRTKRSSDNNTSKYSDTKTFKHFLKSVMLSRSGELISKFLARDIDTFQQVFLLKSFSTTGPDFIFVSFYLNVS